MYARVGANIGVCGVSYRILYRNRCLLQRRRRPGRCCHVFGRPARSRPRRAAPAPRRSLESFLFGKRFSPFLPRDRTLTLRRRSRGVENTGSACESRDETDGCFAFLFIDCAYRYFQIPGHSLASRYRPRHSRSSHLCQRHPPPCTRAFLPRRPACASERPGTPAASDSKASENNRSKLLRVE